MKPQYLTGIAPHLDSTCQPICKGGCGQEVKQSPYGTWFITIGHAGFNSPANNRMGYRSQKVALNAWKRYGRIV